MADIQKTEWISSVVYPPSDDSFLLVDALQHRLKTRSPPQRLLEVGSGSGYVAISAAVLTGGSVLATDVNPTAVECTLHTARAHGLEAKVEIVQTCFWDGIDGAWFEVILFNPPYVPTPLAEMQGCGLSAAWAGGLDGRQVIDAFLSRVYQLMMTHKVEILLVCVVQNRPLEIIEDAKSRGFHAEVTMQRDADEERLYVLNIRPSR